VATALLFDKGFFFRNEVLVRHQIGVVGVNHGFIQIIVLEKFGNRVFFLHDLLPRA